MKYKKIIIEIEVDPIKSLSESGKDRVLEDITDHLNDVRELQSDNKDFAEHSYDLKNEEVKFKVLLGYSKDM